MERVILGRGARGGIVRSVQEQLSAGGYYTGNIDGQYGGGTFRAVSGFQQHANLPVNGALDESTWSGLMRRPKPSVFERALQLTAAFEGHGFGIIQGNWDDAWLTWGVIGFTLKHGEIQKILLGIAATDPQVVTAAFGSAAPQLLDILHASAAQQEAWANSISEGVKVKEPWRSAFQTLGNQPVVQAAQLERARADYFVPALRTAARYELNSERGLALCFDIHVQNGGINDEARTAILQRQFADEGARRTVIANAVADAAKAAFREDVRARKLTIATGAGIVHGEAFTTEAWGIGDYTTGELAQHA
jgi:hypothetical protein